MTSSKDHFQVEILAQVLVVEEERSKLGRWLVFEVAVGGCVGACDCFLKKSSVLMIIEEVEDADAVGVVWALSVAR